MKNTFYTFLLKNLIYFVSYISRNSSDKRNLTDASLLEDQTTTSSRATPTKFSTAHPKGKLIILHIYYFHSNLHNLKLISILTSGSFTIGSLLHIHASYPADGERARIDVVRMDSLLPHDTTLRELRHYPGPLIKYEMLF